MSKQEVVTRETTKKHLEKDNSVSRRDFLKLSATAAAFAGLSTAVPAIAFERLETAQAQVMNTPTEQVISSVCRMCTVNDDILVHVVNGNPTWIEGNPADQSSKGRLCAKGQSGIWNHYDPFRVKTPLKRTNPKGLYQNGGWVEISWEEAYSTIASKIQAARAKGAQGIALYNDYSATAYSDTWATFKPAAVGPNYPIEIGMNYCGHTAHYLAALSHGYGSAFSPATSAADYARCNYLIFPGRTHGLQGGGSFLPYAVLVADARASGMKIVNLSPFMSSGAALADEWIPVAPATEGAVASAMLYVLLVEQTQYDVSFIKQSTNGPYLIGPDGMYVRDPATKKPLIWDPVDSKAKTYDDSTIKDYAILGSFTANGVSCNPSFQLLINAVTPMTPEWAEGVSGAPAGTIRRIATEFATAAQIGATITIQGKTYPFRPAATDYYGGNAANHVHGTANGMSLELLNTVIGGMDAPGGHTNGGGNAGPDGMNRPPDASYTNVRTEPYKFGFPPKTPELKELFPLGDHLGAVTYQTMNNPTSFWGAGNIKLDYIFYHAWNPMLSMFDPAKMEKVWKDAGFVAAICLWIEETAEAFADIILPDRSYLEEYQVSGSSLMQPTCSAPADIPNLHDTLSEIASRAGFLNDYNTALNSSLKVAFKFDVTKKISSADYYDLKVKSTYGADKGLAWFQKNGASQAKGPVTWDYQPWKYKVTPARRIPVYFENHVEVAATLKKNLDANGVQWDYKDYSPLPTWIPSHIHNSTPPYDLTCIFYLSPIHTYTWTNANPLLTEISLGDPYIPFVVMHPQDAKARGISDGDLIWVETAIGRQEGKVRISETIRPTTIAANRSMAGWARNSVVRDLYANHQGGIPQNLLREDNMDYIDRLNDTLENSLKVRVYKAT